MITNTVTSVAMNIVENFHLINVLTVFIISFLTILIVINFAGSTAVSLEPEQPPIKIWPASAYRFDYYENQILVAGQILATRAELITTVEANAAYCKKHGLVYQVVLMSVDLVHFNVSKPVEGEPFPTKAAVSLVGPVDTFSGLQHIATNILVAVLFLRTWFTVTGSHLIMVVQFSGLLFIGDLAAVLFLVMLGTEAAIAYASTVDSLLSCRPTYSASRGQRAVMRPVTVFTGIPNGAINTETVTLAYAVETIGDLNGTGVLSVLALIVFCVLVGCLTYYIVGSLLEHWLKIEAWIGLLFWDLQEFNATLYGVPNILGCALWPWLCIKFGYGPGNCDAAIDSEIPMGDGKPGIVLPKLPESPELRHTIIRSEVLARRGTYKLSKKEFRLLILHENNKINRSNHATAELYYYLEGMSIKEWADLCNKDAWEFIADCLDREIKLEVKIPAAKNAYDQ